MRNFEHDAFAGWRRGGWRALPLGHDAAMKRMFGRLRGWAESSDVMIMPPALLVACALSGTIVIVVGMEIAVDSS